MVAVASNPVYDVKIDWDKCLNAAECRICVNTCPGGVFIMYPVKEHFLAQNAQWQVTAAFISLCTGCNACQRECPRGAITVKS